MTPDLDSLATELYVKTDDLLKESPGLAPWRPRIDIAPRLSDAELVTLAVMQALLGFTSVNRLLATDTSLWTDTVRVVDSTPVECGRSRETVKRSDLAGWAEYGYCASHSRFFWPHRDYVGQARAEPLRAATMAAGAATEARMPHKTARIG